MSERAIQAVGPFFVCLLIYMRGMIGHKYMRGMIGHK